MKKFLSILISTSLILSAATAFAENNADEMQELLALVKERLPDTSNYSEFQSYSYTSNDETIYEFEWSNSEDDNWSYLNVECNGSGIITSYNIYDSEKNNYNSKLSINRHKKAEAIKKAEAAIASLNPQIAKNIAVEDFSQHEDFRSDGYFFSLQRYENSIPVASDTGWLNLDADCNLESFYMTYTTDFDFENVSTTITKEQAIEAYNSKIGANLYYTTIYSDKPQVKLAYGPKYDNLYISATSGEAVKIEPYYDRNGYGLAEESATDMAKGGATSFSAAELKNIDEINGLISEKDAEKIIKDCKYFNIDSSEKLNSNSRYYDDYLKRYTYNLLYINDDFGASVTMDAKTGEILSFNKWNYNYSEDKKEPDKEKISELSAEVISALAKEKASEYKEGDNPGYYIRYVNDIPFDDDGIYISFDNDYNLTSYSMSYSDVDFPAPENIISKEKAFEIISDIGKYEIKYIKDTKNKKFVAVYDLSDYYIIDAFTGKTFFEDSVIAYDGNYSDIAGHYAENQIRTLAEYGIFFEGTELHPDAPLTQKEYIGLLSIVFYYNDITCLRKDYSAETLYKRLPKDFIKGDKSPEDTLTRLDAVKLMVRAMGIEEYAKLPNIYASIYNDVTEDLGYVNLLTGLGVVSGNGEGKFNPDGKITKAQGLIMIYNYLSR